MIEKIRECLLKYNKKTISVEEIEKMVDTNIIYTDFAQLILSLEEEGLLEMVKSKRRNNRNPSLAYSYRIQKQHLIADYHEELKQYRLILHPSIQLDAYFGLDPAQWKHDLPFLNLIHQYIQSSGFPQYEVPAPERSVELVGDEKWIAEKYGKEMLERVGLWAIMKIIPVSDPLMFAINPKKLHLPNQQHLIVENKTTYQALLDALPDTNFSTLIYGSGNKIIKSIEQFDRQLNLSNASHEFYYFGDIDRSGLFIWYRLMQKLPIKLALPFYKACMDKRSLKGKTNQRMDQAAMEAFLTNFSYDEQTQLIEIFNNGEYFPQEVLKTSELRYIWGHATWN